MTRNSKVPDKVSVFFFLSLSDKLTTISNMSSQDINRDSEVDRTMQTLKTLLNSGSASQSSQTQESLNHLLQELGKVGYNFFFGF